MKRISVGDIPLTRVHNTIQRKLLIKIGDSKTKLQTMNYAFLKPKKSFKSHKHPDCEEIYYFLSGVGEMKVDNEKFKVVGGNCILLEQDEWHTIKNTSLKNLRWISFRILI